MSASCCCAADSGYEHLASSLRRKAVLLALQESHYHSRYTRLSRSGQTTTDFYAVLVVRTEVGGHWVGVWTLGRHMCPVPNQKISTRAKLNHF